MIQFDQYFSDGLKPSTRSLLLLIPNKVRETEPLQTPRGVPGRDLADLDFGLNIGAIFPGTKKIREHAKDQQIIYKLPIHWVDQTM